MRRPSAERMQWRLARGAAGKRRRPRGWGGGRGGGTAAARGRSPRRPGPGPVTARIVRDGGALLQRLGHGVSILWRCGLCRGGQQRMPSRRDTLTLRTRRYISPRRRTWELNLLVPWRKECWGAVSRLIPDGSRRRTPRRGRETQTRIPLRPRSWVLQLYSPTGDQEVYDILRQRDNALSGAGRRAARKQRAQERTAFGRQADTRTKYTLTNDRDTLSQTPIHYSAPF